MSELEKLLAAIESFNDSVEDFVSDSTSTKREFEKIALAQKTVEKAIAAAKKSLKPKTVKSNQKIDLSKAKIGDKFTDGNGCTLTFAAKERRKDYPYELQSETGSFYSFTTDGMFFKGYKGIHDLVQKIS